MPPFSSDGTGEVLQLQKESSVRSLCDSYPSLKYPISPISENRVSFNPVVQYSEVPNRDDYSSEEASGTWYNVKELLKIQREVLEVSRRVQRKTLRSDDCERGLEFRTKDGFQRMKENRVNGLFAVLSEQYKQTRMGLWDPRSIGSVYIAASFHCRKEALHVAMLDSLEAQKYQEEVSSYFVTRSGRKMSQSDCCIFAPLRWFSQQEPVFIETLSLSMDVV